MESLKPITHHMTNLLDNIFIGEKIRLTALRKSDLPIMRKWHEDSGFLRLHDSDPALPCTEESLTEWIENGGNPTLKKIRYSPIENPRMHRCYRHR